MKKKLFLFIFCLIAFNLNALQNKNFITEISVKAENIDAGESVWLVPALSAKLASNLSEHKDFVIINNFSEGSSGKTNATHKLMVILIKAGDSYTAIANFIEISTGINKAVVLSSPKNQVQELFTGENCAADEITAELCRTLRLGNADDITSATNISPITYDNSETVHTPKNTEKPKWMTDIESIYSYDEYIAVVGSGYTKDEASINADLEMAGFFGKNIKSNISNSIKNEESKKAFNRDYSITSDMDLFSVSKTNPWYDNDSGLYYICAYLERFQTFDVYRPVVTDAKSNFYNFYNEITKETDFFKKLHILRETKKSAEKYREVLAFAQTIAPSIARAQKQSFDDIVSVDLLMEQLLKDASITVTVNNDYGTRFYDYISDVFSGNGFNISSDKSQYIVEVNIDKKESIDDFSYMIKSIPSITISLKNKTDNSIPFTYARTFDLIMSYTEEKINKKVFDLIDTELKNTFEKELESFLNN